MNKFLLGLVIAIIMAIIFLFYDNWMNELKHLINVNHVH
jgi:hypothetical protein